MSEILKFYLKNFHEDMSKCRKGPAFDTHSLDCFGRVKSLYCSYVNLATGSSFKNVIN